jgi:hypothetical protein
MKIGLSAVLATAIASATFTQAFAHAALPTKPHIESAVTHVTFGKDSKKEKHAHVVRKHHVAHVEKQSKKKH